MILIEIVSAEGRPTAVESGGCAKSLDPDAGETTYSRSTTELPPEPKEIKPHPYGIELGQLVTMLKDSNAGTMSQSITQSV